jgi:hypothetical protein
MAVDPDSVMVTPFPMPRNPNPVNATDVIARPMYIIRAVTNFDVHNDSICHGCHCREHCQTYRTPFIRESKQLAQAPGKNAIDVVTCGTSSRINADNV